MKNRLPALRSDKKAEMTELIFNADDFGLSPSVNQSITESVREGLLKSVSLMMTHPAFEDAVFRADSLPAPPGFGLHFSLTSGTAISPPQTIPLLANSDGRLKNGFAQLARLLASSKKEEAAAEMEREFYAQLGAFEQLLAKYPRCRIDHIDSHQHIHVFPPLFRLFKETAVRQNLFLRIPSEPIGNIFRLIRPPFFFHAKGYAKKLILDTALSRESRKKKNFSHTGYFGILNSGRMNQKTILLILNQIPGLAAKTGQQRYEINLHPWKIRGEKEIIPETASNADKIFGTSLERESEFDTLTKKNSQIRERMSDLGICTSNFGTPE